MRRLTLILAAIALAGCDPAGVEFTDPDDLALQIMRGDGQVGSVQEGSAYVIAAAPPDGVLPDTLVARITDSSGGNANLPPNTVGEFVVTKDGCGEPWIRSTQPDDSADVRSLWERPAGALPDLAWHDVDGTAVWGSLCPMETRAFVDGEFVVSAEFSAIFTPGAAAQGPGVSGHEEAWLYTDTIYAGASQRTDAHGNEHQWRLEVTSGPAVILADDWSQDGRTMVVTEDTTSGTLRLYAVPADTVDGTYTVQPDQDGVRMVRIHWP